MCWWHHTQHLCDILCTAGDIMYILLPQTTVFMMSHPLQAWHYIPRIRHCTHCIFSISVPIIPQQLSVWHHAHYIYDTTVSMYDITWTLYGLTPLELWHHKEYIYDLMKIYIISMLLLSWKHNNYTWHLTHYFWHHSHCICAATPAVLLLSQ